MAQTMQSAQHMSSQPLRLARPSRTKASLLIVLLQSAACSTPPHAPADTATPPPIPGQTWGTLAGTVTDAAGDAITDATVVTVPHGYEAHTDATGAWSVIRLSPETYAVSVRAPGFTTGGATDLAVTADAVTSADVVLTAALPRDKVVTVTALGPTHEPLADAVVTASDGTTALTDALGVATLVFDAPTVVDVTVAMADDSLWPRHAAQVTVPEWGGAQVAVQLAGRADPDASFVGSTRCAQCHDVGVGWGDSAHGHALSDAVQGDLRALFTAGATLDVDGGSVALSMNGVTPTVTLSATTGASQVFAADGLIGDSRSGAVPWATIGDQHYPLPFGWTGADPNLPDWPDAGARLVSFEPDRWFTGAGNFTFTAGGHPAPTRSAERECLGCHATGFTATVRTDGGVDMLATDDSGDLAVELDVGCERCHGPGGSHVAARNADKPFKITRPDLLDTDRANDVCAQCHSGQEALGTALPYPYSETLGLFRSGAVLRDYSQSMVDLWPSGAAAQPGAQADELASGAHGAGGLYAFRCIDCHDPHNEATDADGAPLHDSLKVESHDNTLCASCHLSLTFAGVQRTMERHSEHFNYNPDGAQMPGRCTMCHMPPTTTRLGWHAGSGAGDLSSHTFLPEPPQNTVDVFDTAGVTTLAVGEFPAHSCSECHAYNRWIADNVGGFFFGPTGDPTLRATHAGLQQNFEAKFP